MQLFFLFKNSYMELKCLWILFAFFNYYLIDEFFEYFFQHTLDLIYQARYYVVVFFFMKEVSCASVLLQSVMKLWL